MTLVQRNPSGFNVPVKDTVYMLRSVLVDKATKQLQTEAVLNQIFENRTRFFEITAQPTTIIMPNSANVILASQIFESGFKDSATTFPDYIRDLSPTGGDRITWIAAPSIIFDYRNRQFILEEFSNRTCINMFFSLSEFGSTDCLLHYDKNYTEHWRAKDQCERIKFLKEKCFSEKDDKGRDIYTGWATFIEKGKKFTTNFNEAKEKIIREQGYMDEIHKENNYQKYNELFSNFYPWDIIGIEIGGYFYNQTIDLIEKLKRRRQNLAYYYRAVKKEGSISRYIDQLNDAETNWKNSNVNDYILRKFITECNCFQDDDKRLIINVTNIRTIIDRIIKILETPLQIFEYGRNNPSEYFTLQQLTLPAVHHGEFTPRTIPFELLHNIQWTLIN